MSDVSIDYRDKLNIPVKTGNGGPMDGQHPTSDSPKSAPMPSGPGSPGRKTGK